MIGKKAGILLAFLFFSSLVSAELHTLRIGNNQITYDEVVEADTDNDGANDRQSFYLDDVLVATIYDEDEDGKPDLWFVYDEELSLTLEASDKDNDGQPDEILRLNENEEIVEVEDLSKAEMGEIVDEEFGLLLLPFLFFGTVALLIIIIYVYSFFDKEKKPSKKKSKNRQF